jgi:hypothetical protein
MLPNGCFDNAREVFDTLKMFATAKQVFKQVFIIAEQVLNTCSHIFPYPNKSSQHLNKKF